MREDPESPRKGINRWALTIVAGVIVAILVGTGRFSSLNLTQSLILAVVLIIFIVAIYLLIANIRKILNFLKKLLKIITANWQLVTGLILLLASSLGIYLTKSLWIFLTVAGFLLAIRMLYHYFDIVKRAKTTIKKDNFIPIPIRYVGNKDFNKLYLDFPLGDVWLEGIKFHIGTDLPNRLVFDTASQTRYFNQLPDDRGKEVELQIDKPIKSIKSVYVLINSGNSDVAYNGVKIGEIKLIFSNDVMVPKDLILGKNVREWLIGAPRTNLVRQQTDTLSKKVWQGVNTEGYYAVIDCLKIPVPEIYKNEELNKIVFVHNKIPFKAEDTLGAHFIVSAITVEVY
jgi:hypothetical protein